MIMYLIEDFEEGSYTFCSHKSEFALRLKNRHIFHKLGFIPDEGKDAKEKDKKLVLLEVFHAKNYLEACQKYYNFMGYGEYKPMILEDGEIDPVYLEDFDEDKETAL